VYLELAATVVVTVVAVGTVVAVVAVVVTTMAGAVRCIWDVVFVLGWGFQN